MPRYLPPLSIVCWLCPPLIWFWWDFRRVKPLLDRTILKSVESSFLCPTCPLSAHTLGCSCIYSLFCCTSFKLKFPYGSSRVRDSGFYVSAFLSQRKHSKHHFPTQLSFSCWVLLQALRVPEVTNQWIPRPHILVGDDNKESYTEKNTRKVEKRERLCYQERCEEKVPTRGKSKEQTLMWTWA